MLINNQSQAINIANDNLKLTNKSLLEWIRSYYLIDIKKIEQCCTGAIFCQILDSIHPGKVKMNKINWNAKYDYEFTSNFKILQEAFTYIGISKNIEISRLIKGKLNDNLELLQWFRNYHQSNLSNLVKYDPLKRRNNAEIAPLPCNCNNSNKQELKITSKSVEKLSTNFKLVSNNNINLLNKKDCKVNFSKKNINNLNINDKTLKNNNSNKDNDNRQEKDNNLHSFKKISNGENVLLVKCDYIKINNEEGEISCKYFHNNLDNTSSNKRKF